MLLLNKVFIKDIREKSEEAKKSIQQIYTIYNRNNEITDSLALKLANVVVHYENISFALEILSSHMKNNTILAYAMPLMYDHKSIVSSDNLEAKLINLSETMNHELWCNMFLNHCGIPFQAFDNENLRNVFCEKCMDSNDFIKRLFNVE